MPALGTLTIVIFSSALDLESSLRSGRGCTGSKLDADLSRWLQPDDPDTELSYPLAGLKAVIAPCASFLRLFPLEAVSSFHAQARRL